MDDGLANFMHRLRALTALCAIVATAPSSCYICFTTKPPPAPITNGNPFVFGIQALRCGTACGRCLGPRNRRCFLTLPHNRAVAPVPEVKWESVREMVVETNATMILVCGALGRYDQGHHVTLSVLLPKIKKLPNTLMGNSKNEYFLVLYMVSGI